MRYHDPGLREPGDGSPGPLHGTRIVDFCWAGVGGVTTRLLGDMGAEVLKIESPQRFDLCRTLPPFAGGPPMASADVGKIDDFNRSGFFHNYGRNKRSVAIDMGSDEGRDVCRELIRHSDVVTDNFRGGVLEKWGLSFPELRKLRSDIIAVSVSGFGQTGPQARYGSYGPVAQALSGLVAMAGLPDQVPSGYGYSYLDNTGGYYGTMAILIALYHRNATGEGGFVDMSVVEAGIGLVGPDLLDVSANGRPCKRPEMPPGNRLTHRLAAPHGVYPTNEADRWIAITVFDDEEWEGLKKVIGPAEWLDDDRAATMQARCANSDWLDAKLGEWTAVRDRYALMRTLQDAGVPAGVVQTAQDRFHRDPHIRAREVFPEVDHVTMGAWPVEGVPFRLSESPPRSPWAGSPRLGADTASVLRDLLGMSTAEIDDLADRGIVFCDDYGSV